MGHGKPCDDGTERRADCADGACGPVPLRSAAAPRIRGPVRPLSSPPPLRPAHLALVALGDIPRALARDRRGLSTRPRFTRTPTGRRRDRPVPGDAAVRPVGGRILVRQRDAGPVEPLPLQYLPEAAELHRRRVAPVGPQTSCRALPFRDPSAVCCRLWRRALGPARATKPASFVFLFFDISRGTHKSGPCSARAVLGAVVWHLLHAGHLHGWTPPAPGRNSPRRSGRRRRGLSLLRRLGPRPHARRRGLPRPPRRRIFPAPRPPGDRR